MNKDYILILSDIENEANAIVQAAKKQVADKQDERIEEHKQKVDLSKTKSDTIVLTMKKELEAEIGREKEQAYRAVEVVIRDFNAEAQDRFQEAVDFVVKRRLTVYGNR